MKSSRHELRMGAMVELTSSTLLWVVVVAAVLLPLITVVIWSRSAPGRSTASALGLAASRLLLVVVSQLVAVVALFLWVNNQYGFYNTWADLLGQEASRPEPVATTGLSAGKGTLERLVIHGQAAGVTGQALVWLPPQYQDPRYAGMKFPVLMFLPGQPSSPQHVYGEYNLGAVATEEIAAGKIKPFVAVFPPIMINPPRDTECTDVAGGPPAEKWLVDDVTRAMTSQYRVEPPGKKWSVAGWSTGALCAAKLVLRHPQQFAASVSFGGMYQAYLDNTTGDLFGGDKQLQNENSPLWLYQNRGGTQGTKLLLIAGKADTESWPTTSQMVTVAKGDPNVTLLTFPLGGHNYRNYVSQLPAALVWLQGTGAFG